jgi:hypothetical protein
MHQTIYTEHIPEKRSGRKMVTLAVATVGFVSTGQGFLACSTFVCLCMEGLKESP